MPRLSIKEENRHHVTNLTDLNFTKWWYFGMMLKKSEELDLLQKGCILKCDKFS